MIVYTGSWVVMKRRGLEIRHLLTDTSSREISVHEVGNAGRMNAPVKTSPVFAPRHLHKAIMFGESVSNTVPPVRRSHGEVRVLVY